MEKKKKKKLVIQYMDVNPKNTNQYKQKIILNLLIKKKKKF